MKYFLSTILFFVFIHSLAGQSIPSFPEKDSIPIILLKQRNSFWRQTIAPVVFIGLSAVAWPLNEDVQVIRNRYVSGFHNELDNGMQYAPGAIAVALHVSGVKGRNRLGRAALNWCGGMFIMGALVNSIKYSTRVMRPDETSRNSFPSGHTATAFMNAAFLHEEYGHTDPLYSVLGYTMATYTGISRCLNNRHWLSDVLAGAGIGILSTKVSYLIIDGFYKNKGDFFTSFDAEKELENPSFVSVRFGRSFYAGNAGLFGKPGWEGVMEGTCFFNKKWGIGGELGFMHIPFEREVRGMQSVGLSSLMAGGYYSKSIGKKFILQGKALTGIGIGKTGRDADTWVEIKNNTWMAGGGASLTMLIAPTLGISFYADYKYAGLKTTPFVSNDYPAENKLSGDKRLPINALTGGLKLVAFFR
jgi:membrane-associated phospholipid phosphatase